MSDANLLNPQPIPFPEAGPDCRLGVCDLDTELLFQSAHEAWALNRIEAVRGKVSPNSYKSMMDRHHEAVAANHFAFGGPLSVQWLLSPAGQAEYLALLSARGGKGVRPDAMARLGRARGDTGRAYADAFGKVMRRDFPQTGAAGGESPAPEGGEPSTTESSPPSAGQTENPATKSGN